MPRIISGRYRGRRLKTPAGAATRPTAGRVRQVLFDILAPELFGCRFLDAFAGSGGVGLEALSRGAAHVVLVERDRAALAALRANLEALGGDRRAELVRDDGLAALRSAARGGAAAFDLIFLDPPYGSDLARAALETLADGEALRAGGAVVVEHFHKRPLPETIGRLLRDRVVRVGDHLLSFYRVTSQEQGGGSEVA